MKCFFLVSPGFENLAQQELGINVIKYTGVLEGEVKNKAKLSTLITHLQSVRRVLFSLENPEWPNFFNRDSTFRVEVENVKGEENRIKIAREVSVKIFQQFPQFHLKIDFKNPEITVIVYEAEKRFIGLDLAGEMTSRFYRLFPHSATFKGDLGYYFFSESRFKAGNHLLVGLAKDGVIAIEAALAINKLPLRENLLSFFSEFKLKPLFVEQQKIYAFDESTSNLIAARKNSSLAGVKDLIDFRKCSLEDLDAKYDRDFFDQTIFLVTSKDEGKINEIYHQAKYLLKPGGKLLVIGRDNFKLFSSERFKMISKTEIRRGNSLYRLWVLEKL